MRGLYAVYRKELSHYFVSPVAYVVVGVFLALCGFFFERMLVYFIENSLSMEMQAARFGMPPDIDVPSEVLRSFFGVVSSLILFITPLLTMGVYAEERKRGTMELLMTSPINEAQIVLGKFLGSLTLYAMMLLPTAGYLVFMYRHSEPRPPWGLMLAGYAGVLLLGAALLALGSFLSSLTENQIIAAVLTFGALLVLWIVDLGAQGTSAVTAEVLQYLSVIHHFDDFARGIIDTSSVIYYVSLTVLFLFLTVRAVDSLRWRRA